MMFSENRYHFSASCSRSKHARSRTRADTRNFQMQKGDWCRTHASIGRVTRALSGLCVEFRGPFPPACRRRVFARRRLIRLSWPWFGSIGAR